MFHKKIKTTLTIEGMHCEHCANKVKEALENINNIKKVKVMLKEKQVIVFSTEKIKEQEVKEVIENLGYELIEMISL